MTNATDAELDIDGAQRALRELLRDETITVSEVGDESSRRARLETAVEYRTLARVVSKPTDQVTDPPRDLATMLWDVPAKPEDPFLDEPRAVIEEPKSGAVTDCPACVGKGEAPCDKCGGTTRVPCESCRGAGYVNDTKGASKLCRFCSGNKMQPCAKCKLGTVPCKSCKSSGQAFTIQRITVSWQTHKESSVVALAPPEVPLDGLAPVVSLAARNERGSLTDDQLAALSPAVKLAAQRLLGEHPLPDNGRIRSQTLLIERVPVYVVTYTQKGKSHTVRFVGAPAKPLGLSAPATSVMYTLALLVIVASAVAALYVTGIVRHH
jgi:hypothetical protein